MRRDPSQAPSLWGRPVIPHTPDTTQFAQVSASVEVSGGTSDPDAPTPAPAPPGKQRQEAAEVTDVEPTEAEPVKVGPGLGERLGGWARESFVPPEIWSSDRPSLQKQLTYAQEGAWGPKEGWHRWAAQAAFWAVSLPTSTAAYAIEWVGERPSRWVVALVLISLLYQVPYVPEVVSVLIRIPAWPITATWSLLGLTS